VIGSPDIMVGTIFSTIFYKKHVVIGFPDTMVGTIFATLF
jgi:hypothetical protein